MLASLLAVVAFASPAVGGLSHPVTADRSYFSSDLPAANPDCLDQGDPVFEVKADLHGKGGTETVLASLTGGVTVLDRDGVVIASAAGFACEGSLDHLEMVTAGRAFGEPTIAVVGTTGNDRARWVALFRVGTGKQLEAVFTGEIEDRGGHKIERGSVTLIPNGLVHRLPGGGTALWVFDPKARVYTPRGWLEKPRAFTST